MKHLAILLAFLGAFGLAGLTGCEDDGPMEEMGESMDEAAEDTGEAMEDMTN